MDHPTKKILLPKRKVQHQLLDDDNDMTKTTQSIHHHYRCRRRPVKKRHVMTIINNDETPLLSTSNTTTTYLPDLIQEETIKQHHHTTSTTSSSNRLSHSTTITTTNGVAIHLKKAPEQQQLQQQQQQQQQQKTTMHGHDNDMSKNDIDEFEVIPSPPPFQRSVAQVFQYHHEPQQQQQHQEVTTTTTTSSSSPRLDLVSTSMVLPTTMSPPSTQIMPHHHHHRQSPTSLSYDLPPIHDDMVASLSLKSSSLPQTESFYTEAVMTNYKNHNKILPKGNSGRNTTCLITENESSNEDDNHDKYKNSTAAALSTTTNHDGTAYVESTTGSVNHFHSILLNHHINVPPPTNPMIPPALMSGKVISTKYGLAMLVVPSSDITVSDYSNTFVSPTTIPASAYCNVVSSAPLDVTVNTTTGGSTTPTTYTTRFKHWLKSEDELLHFAIMKQETGPPYMWQQIAHTYFPNTRNANQCKSRWKKIDPSLTKNAFTAEEDEIILKGERDGLSWPDIANQLPGRNSDQIRFRFLNSINPQLLKNVAWTVEEDRILDQAQSELGNKWSTIASLLPGRSENDIKNHWHNRKLKAQRKLKALVAFTKRDQALTNLRNGMYDREHPNNETDVPLMDDATNEA